MGAHSPEMPAKLSMSASVMVRPVVAGVAWFSGTSSKNQVSLNFLSKAACSCSFMLNSSFRMMAGEG